MKMTSTLPREGCETLSDIEIVARVIGGEKELFEILMRRHNQKIYRLIRSVVKNQTETEDAMQEVYVKAFLNLRQFEGKSKFATWLSKIAFHESLSRIRKNAKLVLVGEEPDLEVFMKSDEESKSQDPQGKLLQREMAAILEDSIAKLPLKYRVVFMLREIEGSSILETAEALDLTPQAVKSRMFRANALLKKMLRQKLGDSRSEVFHFAGARCDRMVMDVMNQIKKLEVQ